MKKQKVTLTAVDPQVLLEVMFVFESLPTLTALELPVHFCLSAHLLEKA